MALAAEQATVVAAAEPRDRAAQAERALPARSSTLGVQEERRTTGLRRAATRVIPMDMTEQSGMLRTERDQAARVHLGSLEIMAASEDDTAVAVEALASPAVPLARATKVSSS